MAAQRGLIAPAAEQDELAWVIARQESELDASRLGAARIDQLGQEGMQLIGQANTPVDVGDQHYSGRHREQRV